MQTIFKSGNNTAEWVGDYQKQISTVKLTKNLTDFSDKNFQIKLSSSVSGQSKVIPVSLLETHNIESTQGRHKEENLYI